MAVWQRNWASAMIWPTAADQSALSSSLSSATSSRGMNCLEMEAISDSSCVSILRYRPKRIAIHPNGIKTNCSTTLLQANTLPRHYPLQSIRCSQPASISQNINCYGVGMSPGSELKLGATIALWLRSIVYNSLTDSADSFALSLSSLRSCSVQRASRVRSRLDWATSITNCICSTICFSSGPW